MTSMNTDATTATAHSYALIGRLDHEPAATTTGETTHAQALRRALRGVDLGHYDHRVISLLAGLDDLTIRTLVSLIERARTAISTDASRRNVETWCREWSGWTGTPLAVATCAIGRVRQRSASRRRHSGASGASLCVMGWLFALGRGSRRE